MVALTAVVDDVKNSFRSGFSRGSGFDTEAPADVAAYRNDLDKMSLIGGLLHEGGLVLGEIYNTVTLGAPERKSYMELAHGKREFWDIDLDVYDTAEERVGAMIKSYIASGGTFDDEEEEARSGNGGLEDNVGGSNETRDRSNNGYDTGNEEGSDDVYNTGNSRRRVRSVESRVVGDESNAGLEGQNYLTGKAMKLLAGDVEGGRHVSEPVTRESRFYDSEEEAHGQARIFRKRAEADVYNAANKNFDFDFNTDFNNDWKEYDAVARRVGTQQGALSRHIGKVKGLRLDELREHIGNGYVSTLGIPYVPGEDGERIPGKGRDFTNKEVMKLVNRAYDID